MENFILDEKIEIFLAELDLPNCDIHPKLQTEFICFEKECDYFQKSLCSLCFKKLHETNHTKYEIRTLLGYLLQNQDKILSQETIHTSLPFYSEISIKIKNLETKIEELNKYKKEMLEISETIDKRTSNYLPTTNELSETLKNCQEKQNFSKLLRYLLHSLNMQISNEFSFKKSEFSDSEIKNFLDFFKCDPLKFDQTPNGFESNSTVKKQTSLKDVFRNNDIKTKYFFDEKNMADGLKLLNNNIIVRREEYSINEQRFCLIKPYIKASCKLRIKISKLSSWIGIGLVLIPFIKTNGLKFLYTNFKGERGHYMISQNGYSWSDWDDTEHQKPNSFTFEAGSIIDIDYCDEEKIVWFGKRFEGKKKGLKLRPNINIEELAFAVALLKPGDEVEILNE